MFTRRFALFAAAAAPAAAASPALAARSPAAAVAGMAITTPPETSVRVTGGTIQGFRRGPVYTFKGIPYGAAPVGAARFRPPTPARWDGVRKTLSYGPVSPQPARVRNNPDLAFTNDWDDGYVGEDCLVLNVWSTAMGAAAQRPVMVWLHGGGFTTGSSQEWPAYDGSRLAQRGVVLVSVNHRLGPMGFLDVAGSSSNAGMQDIVLALQWVKDNIGAFGGDPSRVTVFGQSGGGYKVSTLMAMPSARGLFHRGIVMSGSNPPTRTPADARALSEATLAELGVGDLAGLQGLDSARVVAAGEAAMAKLREAGRPVAWGPVFDGTAVTSDWSAAPALSRDIPLMIGNTRDEFRRRVPAVPAEADLPGFVPAPHAAKAPQIIAALHRDYPQARPIDIGGIINAMGWRNAAVEQARRQAALGGAPVYNYWFTYVPDHFDGTLGCPHCADIPYAFDNVALQDQLTGNTPQAQTLADRLAGAFVAFAATGNPGPGWSAFDPARVNTMVFDRRVAMADDPAGEARRLLA